MIILVFIYKEGKFNDNSFLIDGYLFKAPGSLALYVIENNGIRMLIDTSSADNAGLIIGLETGLDVYHIIDLPIRIMNFPEVIIGLLLFGMSLASLGVLKSVRRMLRFVA